MQILNFKYKQNNKFKRVLNFKYNYEQVQQLLFSYRRVQDILNTSAFNEPVAAIKVAAGFITMQELFMAKIASAENNDNFIGIKKEGYKQRENEQVLIYGQTNNLNIYDNLYLDYYDNKLNIYKSLSHFKIKREINVYNDIFAKEKTNILNKFNNEFALRDELVLNKIKETIAIKPDYTAYIFKNYLSKQNTKINNIYKLYFGKQNDKIANINKILESHRKIIANKYKNIYGTKSLKIGIINKDLFSINENKYAYIFKTSIANKGGIYANVNKSLFLDTDNKNANLNKSCFGDYSSKFANLYKHKYAIKNNISLYKHKDIFGDSEYKNAFISKNISANIYNKNLNINKILFSNKNALNGHIDKNISGNKDDLYLQTNNNLFAEKYYLDANVNEHYFGYKDKYLSDIDHNVFFNSSNKNAFIINNIFLHKNYHDTFIQYKDLNLYKDIYKSSYEIILFLHNKYKDTQIDYDTFMLYKNKSGTFIKDEEIFTQKEKLGISVNYENIFLHRNNYNFDINKNISMSSSAKDLYSFNNYKDGVFLKLDAKKMSSFKADEFLNLSEKDVGIFKNKIFIIKDLIDVNIQRDTYFVIKNIKNLYFISKYFGILVPCSLSQKNTFLNRINEFCDKLSKESNILDIVNGTKISLNTDIFGQDLFVAKGEHNIYLQNRIFWAYKEKFLTNYQKDLFFNKKEVNINTFKQENISKSAKNINAFTQVRVKVKERLINLDKSIWLLKEKKSTYIFEQEFLNKLPKVLYINKEWFAGITDRYISLFEQKMLFRKIGEIKLLNLSSLFKENKELNVFDSDLIFNKSLKDMDLYKQIEQIHTLAKESRIEDHIGEWVWSYEPPDPFNSSTFGIDELLLPEVDTRYEDFEDIIFNKKTQKPRNPIKVIDSDTWIAKLPPKHPLPERKNIGNIYTGVVRENYFGVRTSIMHQIYLEFYTLWQSHIFEFASMTMLQSLKRMLDYLYAYILENYNEAQLPEALRVYHQIRWFGECAVLNNSQYIVSIERDTLKSNLHTGGCDIPNNLNSQDTMYIDSTPGICAIRNNEAYIGSSNAYVEFYLKTHANTSIRFDLINTIGSVNIYIDNKLVDTVSTSKIGLAYLLDYTGETITVRIEKEKESNLNNRFYICNISVEKESFKDLSIDFDPTLKAGNAPMDEIAKKMIQYAEQYDDIIEAYEHIKKANLGVSVTVNQMMDYWDKHHQDKLKGKRLTIKRT